MSRRTAAYVGIALALLVLGRLLSTGKPLATPPATSPPVPATSTSSTPATASPPAPSLRRPSSSVVTLGVLADRPENELSALVDRDTLIALVAPESCGDEGACEAVRATLRDQHATTLQVIAASDWNLGRIDVDASAGSLSSAERASIPKRPRVVMVNVAAATSPQHLAVRAAFAAAAVIARKIDGLVHDPLLARIETARAFAAHAVTAPLEDSSFRRDRIEVLYEPKEEGTARILTAGLSRWGQPDVEAARVPLAAQRRVGEIVLTVAAAIADGKASPLTLSRDDIGRALGQGFPEDAGLPPVAPVTIDLASVRAEAGDPNDFIARVEPAEGDGPIGYVDLAERFFGPLLALSPDSDAIQEGRAAAQRQLVSALSKWDGAHGGGRGLLVQLPFDIPGDAGTEWMWVEMTRHDARSVTGKIVDEPLGATDVTRGDVVTRPLSQVQGVRLTGPRGGS